ncbi:MAG: cation transporter [Selenomonadaceae bacterium]|nr:cation transporter [Selenomonadaceae bacterium]MBQ3726831.1 cation transporter [Selenomonadaceae bacterium]MBQ9498150.1 cation transporter [Selenomonadaceae bacterium]
MLWQKFFKSREGFGQFISGAGICINLLLSGVKIFIGAMSGAISIIADGLNNLSDVATSAIMLAGFRIAAMPPDEEHPFGHGRAEYLAGLFVAAGMILVGGKLLLSSVDKIISPEDMHAGFITMFVLGVSVLAKFFLGLLYRFAARKINSQALGAAALDSFTDCLATSVVIFSIYLWIYFDINIDGAAGVFVSAFILRGGFSALKDILNPLLGDRPDPDFLDRIKKIVTDSPHVLGVHDLIVHRYGAKQLFVSMHVEMPATLSLLDAHEIIDRLERKLQSTFQISATLHVDPVICGDPAFDEHRALAEKILAELGKDLSLHDFRVVPYKSGRKLIFDVLVPQNFPLTDRDIRKNFLRRLIELHHDDRAVIHLDHQFC